MTVEPPAGFWHRLFAWLRGDPPTYTALTAPAANDKPDPVRLRMEEELWLDSLVVDVAEGRRTDEVGSELFTERIDSLWSRGHERLATEWLVKFIDVPATPDQAATELRSRLVELLYRREDLAAALVHLEALARVNEHHVRAHYLLGEHYRRKGDEVRALRHYEAVLAREVDYPNVRVRVERLRAARGQLNPASMGETIAGAGAVGVAEGARYQLIRELGRGATGVVYMARDFELERDVAIKLLHPHLAATHQAAACARFFEEARIAASLRHPNILAILDLDEAARRIVMELAAGGTLRTVLRDRGPRPVRRALERHAQILSALAAAHRRGVVHRDLKPGNLMFRHDPDAPGAEIVLGDFGIAHLPNAHGETGARAAADRRQAEAVGTLAYMSPEQRRGADADPRSDLYAAAVVLFEMLVGRPPWTRAILLAGTRSPHDFRLPATLTTEGHASLMSALQEHLDRLGDPDPTGRPDTGTALAKARELRDLAIADAS